MRYPAGKAVLLIHLNVCQKAERFQTLLLRQLHSQEGFEPLLCSAQVIDPPVRLCTPPEMLPLLQLIS